jgi:uncharacterized membrane protein
MFSPNFFVLRIGTMALAMLLLPMAGGASLAALKICNKTQARVGIAVGSAQDLSLASQGWFNVKPGSCEDVLKGDLGPGPYFIHAIDYDRGGEWGGPDLMCISDGEFQIDGTQDCYARGYTRAGFRRIETNGQKHWSLDLTDGNRGSSGGNE